MSTKEEHAEREEKVISLRIDQKKTVRGNTQICLFF